MDILQIRGISLIVCTFLNLILTLILWTKGKDKTTFYLGWFGLFSAVYAFTFGEFIYFGENKLFWAKTTWIGILILPTYLTFIYYFVNNIKYLRLKFLFWYGGAIVITYISLTTSLIVRSSVGLKVEYGPLEPVGRLYIFICLIVGLIYLLREYFKSGGFKKSQLKYFILGMGIYAGGGILTAGIIPLFYPNFQFIDASVYFSLIWIGLTSYAILKNNLFEIRVLLTELLVGVMAIILVVLPFLMPTSTLKILTITIFLLFCLFGYYLITATHQESKRREGAERLVIQERVLREKAEKVAKDFQRLTDVRNQMFLTGQHHSRTPLSNIKNLSSVLLENVYGPLNKEQKWAVKTILEKSQESIDLTNLYLTVAELEAGKEVISEERTKLDKIVREQIKKLSYDAKLKNIGIIFKPIKDLPEIRADPEKIGVAYFTILDNGLKYTPKGGKVILKLKKTEKNSILFSCQDEGIGMEKDELFNLGQIAYQRSERARGFHGTGIGLGLYLTNLIIKAHKGKFWAESEGKDKGTTFFVELPIK